MVNFTCNTCGDSLKKKDVATHFSRKRDCSNACSLTCFDCLKVFGKDFTLHTICVSENQRYGANGLSGVEKNKQQLWNEKVHEHLNAVLAENRSSLSKNTTSIIQFCLQNSAIPKKEKPFMNFIRNLSRWTEDDARAAWSVISEVKPDIAPPQKNDKPQKENQGGKRSETNGAGDEITSKSEKQKKKKKKSSESAETVPQGDDLDNEGANDENDVDGDNATGKTKKKKKTKSEKNAKVEETTLDTSDLAGGLSTSMEDKTKKKKTEAVDVSIENRDDDNLAMDVEENAVSETKIISKKERKALKKREKYEAEMKAVENATKDDGDEQEEEAIDDGKKKKSKKLQSSEDQSAGEAVSKGKKKRQRTVSMLSDADLPKKKNKENDENVEPEEAAEGHFSGQKDFKWADVIIKVLQSQNDKEMSVKRLCKKVVNEYLSTLLENTHIDEAKATAKFQKKLYKTPGVFVHKDKAKLKAE